MQIARRMHALGGLGDAFASFDSLDQILRQGIDIVDFTVGDPDFATPAHIADAASKPFAMGTHTTRYHAASLP
ncbi:MAG: hypothetical protein OXG60_13830 [Chloroflexi bacterium]|nr:hypothetical protein [Chloroflexota bacterium]